jgi:parallel beta-helix repeat protein
VRKSPTHEFSVKSIMLKDKKPLAPVRGAHNFAGARWRLRWTWLAGAGLVLAAVAFVAVLYILDNAGITPRSLGPYIERRSDGHNPAIKTVGHAIRQWLVSADRGQPPLGLVPWSGKVGMQTSAIATKSAVAVQEVLVLDNAGLQRAIAAAVPGQVITLVPGRYRVERRVDVVRPGNPDAPIVVRAQVPGSVRLDMATEEGFKVSAPYWRFENLLLQGSCSNNSCEHAFHVVGNAHHFAAVNNLIVDFDAHFKINAEQGRYPDYGLLESNTLRNNSVRMTLNPVTPIDLVTASHWLIRRNLISDFIKGEGDRISYGAFAKGAGSDNLLEQNVVLCEDRLRGAPGQRIGLSLGGGGTGKAFCRDGGKCITEQMNSTLRANLIASCSDDGIYLNAAARSKLLHNTLVDTGGISVRFPSSSAEIDGNLVDGIIRSRDNGILHMGDNSYLSAARLYAGSHPQRELFRDPLAFDFRWRQPAARRTVEGESVPDLCGDARSGRPRYGAFDDFAGCLPEP